MQLKTILLSLLLLMALLPLQAQELNCTVQINDAQIDVADKRVFREMERSFTNFLNNTKWTEDTYDFNEKINCTMQITISSMPSIGTYQGTLVIRAVRPVFNTSYTTSTFTFVDRDFNFNYIESQPINFNVNAFNDNLSSMLAFYAYVVLGMDYDSFSLLGGSFPFQQAVTLLFYLLLCLHHGLVISYGSCKDNDILLAIVYAAGFVHFGSSANFYLLYCRI